jgi:hypothetical protein
MIFCSSNILIGFLSFLKRHPEMYLKKDHKDKPHMSHEALALILERGRPVSRRELAASKPLYQPLDTVFKLGFEVHLFQRVLQDSGDDHLSAPHSGPSTPSRLQKGHRKSNSKISSSSDADQGSPKLVPHSIRTQTASTSSNGNGIHQNGTLQVPPPRPKYREQGVDEILQLKLYQSVVSVEPPPPGATIILATGDGASSQFNADGFPGTVKTALKKGWNVELYAWESGLSGAWEREFGGAEAEYRDRFSIRGLEMFVEDLLALDL